MKALCLTAWNRPELLRGCLLSLAQLHHLHEWKLFVQVEPSEMQEEIFRVLRCHALPCEVHVSVNAQRLGVRANPLACLRRAYQSGAELFLLLEDDLELSPDALMFVEQAAGLPAFVNRFSCGNLHFSSCFNQAHLRTWDCNDPTLPCVALETQFLSSLGLFFLRSQFQDFVQPHWWAEQLKLRDHFGGAVAGWDCALNQAILLQGRRCLQSLLPRVIHRGVDGVHSDAVLHQRSYAHAGLYQSAQPLGSVRLYSVDQINSDPDGTEAWGVLFRMAGQLWTLQRSCLQRELQLQQAVRSLKEPLLHPSQS